MAKAVQKITLSPSRDIPFNKLVLSQANVRRIKAGVSIEELAEDIARRSLLQSLNVRPLLDANNAETGLYEIPAGGRRYRALERLVKQKRLAKTAPVPCVVVDATTSILAEDDSLAENLQRAPLHPLDQFRAFQAMRAKTMSEEDIAAAFFISVHVVRQRLRLAAISEKLLAIYAEDGLSLDQLMAFTVTSDHDRQEQVWETVRNAHNCMPYQIRQMLTERTVRACDKRARFVGLDTYEQAGGTVLRDLFHGDDGGWLGDAGLLDRLVVEKLKREADTIAAEGWKWIEVATEFPYGHTQDLRKLDGAAADLTPEDQAAIDALNAEYAKLEAEFEGVDELPEGTDTRLWENESALEAFATRPRIYDPSAVARAGAFVSIGPSGKLSVERGYVRPEDELSDLDAQNGPDGDRLNASAGSASQRAVITMGGQPAEPEEDDLVRPLPERVMLELTAHRTLALCDAVANNPRVALTALLHKLVADTFQRGPSSGGCLEVAVRPVFFSVQAADLKDSPSARSIAARQEAWAPSLPGDDQTLWDWLEALDDASRLALLAHCVSAGVNALVEKADRCGGNGVSQQGLDRRRRHVDRLAAAVGLDMVEAGWKPTVENYLGRVAKPRILDAVREAKGERSVQLIDHLKKGEMATEAERLLDGTGWLPEPLRLKGSAETASVDSEAAVGPGGEALTAFPTGENDESPDEAIVAE